MKVTVNKWCLNTQCERFKILKLFLRKITRNELTLEYYKPYIYCPASEMKWVMFFEILEI